MVDSFSVIGKNITRIDALEKVTGMAKYCPDLKMDDMLYAKLLRSPYPHAKVLKIDTLKAEKLPGVRAVATIEEVPKVFGVIDRLTNERREQSLYLHDNVVRFIGDPVAAVAADDEETAEEALSLIEVDYEQLPAVFDPIEAMKEDAPRIHEKGNTAFHFFREFGSIEKGFNEADYVFEERFVTSKQKHCSLEPFATCIAHYGLDGRLTVYSSSQRPHVIKIYLAGALGLPVNRVRIVKPYTGGAFGGRDYLTHGLEVMCSFLSKKTGKPVKMSFTRDEDFEATESRHPFIIDMKIGVTADGTLTAIMVKAIKELGGYGPHMRGPLSVGLSRAAALYSCPNILLEGYSVFTNKSPGGGFRAYGNPQTNFAQESMMDMIAEKLGMDPIELRLKNYRRLGEIEPMTNDEIRSCGMEECIVKGAEKFGWNKKKTQKPAEGTKRRGVGMSCLAHQSGARFGLPDAASAMVMLNYDGSVNLITAAVDDGQGNRTVLAQIAAEELNVDFDQVSVSATDTDITPFDSGTHGSRQTYAGGIAVRNAAAEAKKSLFAHASQHLNVAADRLRIKDGVIYDVKNDATSVKVKELLQRLQFGDLSIGKQIVGFATGVAPSSPSIFGANFAEVEVDTETGQVRVLKLVSAFDVGKAINPAHVEGQMAGGIALGVGYALTEGLIVQDGKVMNSNFKDYRILRAGDVPEIDLIIVENEEPTGPFGAKGVGEATNTGTAGAIANAIYNAVGVRVHELPITQEKVLEGLQ
jgi:xanthine dehydrogenase molybdenum-binding subunit